MRVIFYFMVLFPIFMCGQEKITINNVDELSLGYKNGRKAKVCNGNVSFSQGDMTLTCTQAYLYDDINEVEATGNVVITQPGTTVTGGNLYYYGNTNQAIMTNNVVLNDGESTLNTNSLNYNTKAKFGYYSNSAIIVSKNNTLTSVYGSYSGNTKMYGFKNKVRLVNPEYIMESDTLQYHTPTNTAFFFGPTTIKAESNTIYCKYGWYNTQTEKSLFTKGASIESDKNTIFADSMLYDRTAAIGKAFGNIKMLDTAEKVVLYGQKGFHYRNGGLTTIFGNPLAKKAMEDDDTLWLIADTFNYISDDTMRKLSAYKNAKIKTLEMDGVSDSLIYNVSDSLIEMYYQPILWTQENEIYGKFISILLQNNRINKMNIFDSAWIIQEEYVGHYNQIKGDTIFNFFENNKLKTVKVLHNAESIYYAKENDSTYTGMNSIACERMNIILENQSITKIIFLEKPKAMLYPVDKIPADKLKLVDFKINTLSKPSISQFFERVLK